MSVTTGTFPGVRIVDMPDLGAVNDSSSVVGERAGSGRFSATAFRSYVLADSLNVKRQFGAVGNGVADDTAALSAAFASGQSLYFPAGTYNVTGPLTVHCVGQRIEGDGELFTTIRTNQPTGDLLTLNGQNVNIGYIGFTASVTRTSAAFINIGDVIQVSIHDFYMTAFYVGINIGATTTGGNSIYIERGTLLTTVPSGFGIQVNGGVVIVLRDLLIEGNNTGGTQLTAGVNIGASGDITLDHVSTIWAGHGVEIAPAPSTTVQAVWIVNSFFDTGSGFGIYANAVSNGSLVQLLKIADCWVATNSSGGIALTSGGTGTIQQCDILNTISSNNTGHGLFIGPRVTSTRVLGCSFGSNTSNGIIVSPSTLNFQIIGNWIGAAGEFVGNTSVGLVISNLCANFTIADNIMHSNATGLSVGDSCDNFTIADNIMSGNTTNMGLGTLPGNPGVSYWIRDNIGFSTRNFGNLITTAGPTTFTINHGLSSTPNIAQVRLTLCTPPGAATYYYATNPTATTFQIAFNAAPGAGVVVGWEIHTLGG